MTTQTAPPVQLRAIEPADGDEVARIVYEAFAGIHDHHRFERDFPTLAAAVELTTNFIAHPSIHGVVAEIDGRVVGSSFLDERGPVRGVGPITVDPAAQGRGVGRALVQAVLDRGGDALGVRLLQDSFNTRSLSLYASLGFDVAEPAHAVAETEDDMAALIAGTLVATNQPGSFLLPTRRAELFRWCLAHGLRVVKPMTYMTVGQYETPAGSWIPSVLY
jgi:GNAT superfamily N-acetyltransferase